MQFRNVICFFLLKVYLLKYTYEISILTLFLQVQRIKERYLKKVILKNIEIMPKSFRLNLVQGTSARLQNYLNFDKLYSYL